MTHHLELTPEMETRLQMVAHQNGRNAENYLRFIVEAALENPAGAINDPAKRATALPGGDEQPMRVGKSEIYLHFVWATYRRYPWIVEDLEEPVYSSIQAECKKQDCNLLAIGGMPDHVHLAVEMPTKLSPAYLMQRVKGVSSTIARQAKQGHSVGWQDGYGVFSISRTHKERVIGYVKGQKRHHSLGAEWPEWEAAPEANR